MKYLQGGVGIPNVHAYYGTNDHNFMIVDLLGLSLEELFQRCNRGFELKTILMLGEQMVTKNYLIYNNI